MSEELNQLPPELAEVERTLGGFRPARAGGVDRDRLMYDAGGAAAVRAARGRVRLWQGACGVLVIACAAMTVGLVRGTDKNSPPHLAKSDVITAPTHSTPASSRTSFAAPGAVLSQESADEDWATISLPGLRPGAISNAISGAQSGGGSTDMPALQKGDGLDSLPSWQRRAVLAKGSNS